MAVLSFFTISAAPSHGATSAEGTSARWSARDVGGGNSPARGFDMRAENMSSQLCVVVVVVMLRGELVKVVLWSIALLGKLGGVYCGGCSKGGALLFLWVWTKRWAHDLL